MTEGVSHVEDRERERERKKKREGGRERERETGIEEWGKKKRDQGAQDSFVPLRYPFSSDESIRRGLVSVNSGVGVSRTVG